MRFSLSSYLPPGGFGAEAAGEDCFIHILSWQVISWLSILLGSLMFLLLAVDLPNKKGSLMKPISLLAMAVCLSNNIHFALSLYYPVAVRWAQVFVNVCFGSWGATVIYKLTASGLIIVSRFSGDKSRLDLLGGAFLVYSSCGLLGSLLIVAFVGLLGQAILYDPLNEKVAFPFFQCFCIGFALATQVGFVIFFFNFVSYE
jgi:hypothetical protein